MAAITSRLGLPTRKRSVLLRYVRASSPSSNWHTALPDHKDGWSIAMARCQDVSLPLVSKIPRVSPVKDSVVSVVILSFISSVHGLSPSSIQHIALPDHKNHLSNAMIVFQDAFPARCDLSFGHAAGILESHRSRLCRCHYSGMHDSGRPCSTTPWSSPFHPTRLQIVHQLSGSSTRAM